MCLALYDTVTKKRSREKILNFIEKNLKSIKRKDFKVLCLAGEEALEIFEVYDKLMIPRENIVCVERIKTIANKISALNLGIEVYYGTVLDYLRNNTDKKFHVVSLDYQGFFRSHIDDIREVQNHLEDLSVVYTNFCGAREKLNSLLTYNFYDLNNWDGNKKPVLSDKICFDTDISNVRKNLSFGIFANLIYRTKIINEENCIYFSRGYDKVSEIIIDYVKMIADYLKEDIFSIFNTNDLSLLEDDIYSTYYKLYEFHRTQIIQSAKLAMLFDDQQNYAQDFVNNLFIAYLDYIGHDPNVKEHKEIKKICDQKNSNMAIKLLQKSSLALMQANLLKEHKNYTYVGISGLPMHGDLFLIKQNKLLDGLDNLFKDITKDPSEESLQLLNNLLNHKHMLDNIESSYISESERLHLGYESEFLDNTYTKDSSKIKEIEEALVEITGYDRSEDLQIESYNEILSPVTTHYYSSVEIIEKARNYVISEKYMGGNHEEIIKEIPQISSQSAGAILAHLTRGNYDDLIIEKGYNLEEFKSRLHVRLSGNKRERISVIHKEISYKEKKKELDKDTLKDQAISYVNSERYKGIKGKKAEEIMEAVPGITKGSASAIAAIHDGRKSKRKQNTKKIRESRDKDVLLRRVASLKLSNRTNNCLRSAQIEYVFELVQKNPLELLQIDNFGKNCLNEIHDALLRKKLYLNMQIDEEEYIEKL